MEGCDDPIYLNLGCGPEHLPGMINVDNEVLFKPDRKVHLHMYPWPWDDNEISGIIAAHILEHMPDWPGFITECSRILKPGGTLEIVTPHWNDLASQTEVGHLHIFSPFTFKNLAHGIPNHWWDGREHLQPGVDRLPLKLEAHQEVIKTRQWWVPRAVFKFLVRHTLGFCVEQRFMFRKLGNDDG